MGRWISLAKGHHTSSEDVQVNPLAEPALSTVVAYLIHRYVSSPSTLRLWSGALFLYISSFG